MEEWVESAWLRPSGLLGNQRFQARDPLMEISDGVGGPLESSEPAFQGHSVPSKLFPLLLQAGLLPRVGRK
jgi:hypothetical protein